MALSLLLGWAASTLSPAHAATFTWDASGGNATNPTDGAGTWSTSNANWSSGSAPDVVWSNSNNAVFGNNNGAAGTITVGTVSVGNITFNPAGSGSYTLSSGTITLTTGTIATNAAAATISARLSGSVGLTTTGTGALTLSGAGITYTGTTTVTSGTLSLLDTTSFGSATTNVNSGGTLLLETSATGHSSIKRITNLITGSGTLVVNSPNSGINGGWITFDASNDGLSNFTGTVNVLSGVLDMDDLVGAWSGNPELNVMSGGLFTLRGQSISVDALTGNGDVFNGYGPQAATLTVGAANGSGTFSGIIHGANAGTGDYTLEQGVLSLVKSGTGIEILTGSNTYAGSTTVNSGTLELGGSGVLGSGSYAGAIANSASLVFASSAPQILTGALSGAGTYVISSGATVNFNQSGTLSVPAGTFTGGGTLIKSGTGIINFIGNSSVAVNISFASGALIDIQAGKMGNGDFLGNWTNNLASMEVDTSGTLDLFANNVYVDALTGSGTVVNSYYTPTTGIKGDVLTVGVANGSGTFAGQINGAGTTTAQPGQIQLVKTGTGTEILTGSNSYAGSTTINAGTLQIGNGGAAGYIGSTASVSGASGGTLLFNLSSSGTFSPAITGGVGLTQGGSGTITLTGADTYTGATSVNTGHLTVTNLGSFASSTVIASGGTFEGSVVSGTQTVSANETFTGTGLLLKTGAGAWSVGGSGKHVTFNLSAGGQIDIQGGMIQNGFFDNEFTSNLGSVNIASGAILDTYGEGDQIDALTGSGTVQDGYVPSGVQTITVGVSGDVNNAAYGVSNNTATFSGIISNTGAGLNVLKTGAGTQILTGSNTYTGTTTVNGGTLQIGNGTSGSYSSSSATTVSGSGTLAFDEATSSIQSNTISNSGMIVGGEGVGIINTLSGAISGTGGFTQSGAGETSLSAANSYSGTTSVTSGTLQLDLSGRSGSISMPSANSIGSAGTLVINSNSTFSIESEYSGSVSVSGSGTFNKTGAGDFELTGGASIKNFTGQVNIMNGILGTNGSDWGSSTGLMNINIASGAYLDLRTGNVVINQLTGSGTAGSSYNLGDTLSVGNGNGSSTFAGSIVNSLSFISNASGGGVMSLVKNGSGTLTLSGANSYTGTTNVNSGTLQIGNGGSTGSLSSSTAISGSSGATLAYDLSTSSTVSNTISGGIGVTQAGTGTLTIGNQSYTGPTTALSGTLIVAGSISGNLAVNGATALLGSNASVGGNASVAGGTLGGGGSFVGASEILGNAVVGTGSGAASSSIIAPSVATGSAGLILSTFGNLTLNSDAAYQFKLNSNSVGVADEIAVNGVLTLAGAILTGSDIGNTVLATNGSAQYVLADAFGGSIVGTFANASQGGLIEVGSNFYTVDYNVSDGNGGNEIVLTAAIPEPGTWGTVLVGFAMLIGLQRRRHGRS